MFTEHCNYLTLLLSTEEVRHTLTNIIAIIIFVFLQHCFIYIVFEAQRTNQRKPLSGSDVRGGGFDQTNYAQQSSIVSIERGVQYGYGPWN